MDKNLIVGRGLHFDLCMLRTCTIMATVVECGSLHCQRDCYARTLSTVVVSCVPSAPQDQQHGKFAVQLKDTVLFPEGGGQVR